MIPLIIDNNKLKALKEFAESHPIHYEEMKQIAEGTLPPPGDREGYICLLDYGFKLVYSIEEHPRKDGKGTIWGKHMSMSLEELTGTRIPSIIAVQLICQALDFKPLEQCWVNFNQNFKPQYVEVFCEIEK